MIFWQLTYMCSNSKTHKGWTEWILHKSTRLIKAHFVEFLFSIKFSKEEKQFMVTNILCNYVKPNFCTGEKVSEVLKGCDYKHSDICPIHPSYSYKWWYIVIRTVVCIEQKFGVQIIAPLVTEKQHVPY